MKKNILIFAALFLFVKISYPQNIADKYSQAMNAYSNHRYVEAYNLFEEFFHEYKLMDELNSTAKYYAAEALLNIGKKESAAVELNYLINNFEWSNFRDKALYDVGLIYFDLSRYQKAEKH